LSTPPSSPVLLAERQGIAFVAAPHGIGHVRLPRRYREHRTAVVALPATEDEVRSAEILPPIDPDAWPQALPRPDLLLPALSRLVLREQSELTLQRGRDGVKGTLVGPDGRRHPFPIAPRDALGLLAAVFRCAPRGVVPGPATGAPPRLLLGVWPGTRPHEYRLRVLGAAAAPPAVLADLGLSPALHEIVVETLDRPNGLVLVAGGSGSGCSTTLDRMAQALVLRGRSGGRIGPRVDGPAGPGALPWVADGISDWPFPESLKEVAPDFVLLERIEEERDVILAGRLAAAGTLVLAGTDPGDPEALARRVRADLERASLPHLPVSVLLQALVRAVCSACRAETTLEPARALRLGFHRRDLEEMERLGGFLIGAGRGCAACAGTGCSGLLALYAWAGAEGFAAALPSLREEGWRRVAEGSASHDDVTALPGSDRAMRSLREIQVLAGTGPGPRASSRTTSAREAAAGSGAPIAARSGTPASDAPALRRLLDAAPKIGSPAPFEELSRTLAGHADDSALDARLCDREGVSDTARRACDVAIIAARLLAALGSAEDAPAAAFLALSWETGPGEGNDEPPFTAEEPTKDALRRIGEVMASEGGVRARADLRVQAVALASLVHRTWRDGRARGLDLHDVTSLVMAQHGQRFSPMLFRALLRTAPIFPIGCTVELSSGDRARVVEQNENNHFRPRVEIGSGRAERRVVDLARAPFLHIRQRVAEGKERS
jgi:hypothetical protein